jgi:hypothetical protein
MEPGIHSVRTRWIRGFIAFHLAPEAARTSHRLVLEGAAVTEADGIAPRTCVSETSRRFG